MTLMYIIWAAGLAWLAVQVPKVIEWEEPMQDHGTCKFNHGVVCDHTDRKKCKRCGWNPKEDRRRREEIREERQKCLKSCAK